MKILTVKVREPTLEDLYLKVFEAEREPEFRPTMCFIHG